MPSWQRKPSVVCTMHDGPQPTSQSASFKQPSKSKAYGVVQDHVDSFSERSLLTCKDTETVNCQLHLEQSFAHCNAINPIAKYQFALVLPRDDSTPISYFSVSSQD
ncbi:hypothetical protein SLA2020_389970 [Shorea laevis]